MPRTRIQIEADRRSSDMRRALARDLAGLRTDAGLSRTQVAAAAGVHRSLLDRIEGGVVNPPIETYARIAGALGADLSVRLFPNTGSPIHDRHQSPMAGLVLREAHARWLPTPEVRVRRPSPGWIDLALLDRAAGIVVATELESLLRRIEQLIRWSTEKASSLVSADQWPAWSEGRSLSVSRLLVVRWTRGNRLAVREAQRLLRAAYPANPHEALDALHGDGNWPGAALLWARLDLPAPRLEAHW